MVPKGKAHRTSFAIAFCKGVLIEFAIFFGGTVQQAYLL
jgi:hypothetical protein